MRRVLPILLTSVWLSSGAQTPSADLEKAVIADLWERQGQQSLCASRDSSFVDLRMAVEAELKRRQTWPTDDRNLIARAAYAVAPCPFSPYRDELKAAAPEDVKGAWLYDTASQKLRFGPKSEAWRLQAALPIKCEAIAYYEGGEARVTQFAGKTECPFSSAQDLQASRKNPAVQTWRMDQGGKLSISRSDMPGHIEEWEVFVVRRTFVFASVDFRPGDLVQYLRKTRDNDFYAATQFRHLQRLGDTPPFDRFTSELTRLLETDATTVLARGTTHEFARQLCARLGGPVASEVAQAVDAWKLRNDRFNKSAAQVINDFADRYAQNAGESGKQNYLQGIMLLVAKTANARVSQQLGGATLDNTVVPPERPCYGLATLLDERRGDFEATPDVTRALVTYMQKRSGAQ